MHFTRMTENGQGNQQVNQSQTLFLELLHFQGEAFVESCDALDPYKPTPYQK